MNSKVYDNWLKINVILHNKLEELKVLEIEKQKLIEIYEASSDKEGILKKMNRNVSKYDKLLKEINELNNKAELLKKSINE